jgi:hypothetical protein
MTTLPSFLRCLLSILPMTAAFSLQAASSSPLKSPDGKLEAKFRLTAGGAPRYTVKNNGRIVLREPRLGLVRILPRISR